MNLAETQALFYAVVTRAVGTSHASLGACFIGSRDLPVERRMEIYANMYLWRLCDALRDNFPKLAALLGEEAFFELGGAYVQAHPSEHYDIGRYGQSLPAFLRMRPELAGRPDAAELAELEWARAEVFQEAHVPPLARELLGQRLGEDPEHTGVALVPALRILRLDHDVVGLFRRLDEGHPPEGPVAEPTALAVWRPRHEVFHTRLDADEATALELARDGACLASICAAFNGAPDSVRAAFITLSSWLDEGFVATVQETSDGT